ncbi:MAG: PKD domain-containing protein [Flavisolibacter sp.]
MKVMRAFLLMVMTLTVLSGSYAQVLTPKYVSTTPNSGGYYEYLPEGYATNNNNYPLVIFLHGLGELGNGNSTDLPRLLNTGLPQRLSSGQFPTSFTSGGQSYRFLIICPQFINWPSAWDVNEILNYVIQHYRVDLNRIYVTGLSMGGGVTWEFAGAYSNRVAAIVPISGASGPDPGRAQNMANAHVAVWATHNQWDPTVPSSNTIGYVDLINQYNANPAAKKTIFQVSGHDAWTQTYDPNFRENSMNVFEWMLQYSRGGTLPAVNQAPTVNAGTSQTLTLPTSSLTLSGSASDPDGTITAYQWTKVSGGNVSFGSPAAAATTVSGLAQGSYVFRLTATDNVGATAYADVTVTVNAAPTVSAIPTANDPASYLPYTGTYSYGVNPGYYGSNWSGQQTATLAMGSAAAGVKGVGVKSFRLPLYDDFLSTWGLNNLIADFDYNKALGASEITAFVGHPSAAHALDTSFAGSPEKAKVFQGMYEPIWLDAARTQINPANTYAKYLYDVVNTYGKYVKFWEIVNEPDFTYSTSGWYGDSNPPTAGSWFDHNPTAAELVNLRAPVFYYIRMLRVSWEVVKKLSPSSYVCTGGIGYRSFLDALLRNTDNPVDGSVTNAYPLKAGAYFDVLSFHTYPMYALKQWNSTTGSTQYFRHSDAAATAFVNFKNNMDSILGIYGYNGSTYPAKQFICTETGVSRIMSQDNWGSNEGQKNYLIKAQVAAQRSGIRQTYWFQLGDGAGSTDPFDQMGLYYYFGADQPYTAKATDQGVALKTTSDLLYGKTFDPARTASLQLPSTVDGGAFRGADGNYVYVLWARTTTDLSEAASASYSFPAAVLTGNVTRKEWNFSATASASLIPGTGIALTGSPVFLEPATASIPATNLPPVVKAGAAQTLNLPTSTTTLSGSATDADGNIVSYQWLKISGANVSFGTPGAAATTVSGLAQGSYVFRLTATDNGGATAYADVTVTVNAAVNQPPTVNAGQDQVITLPGNSLTLSGSASDPDGTIASYQWTKISGGSAILSTPAAASTTISGLAQGVYVFRLTVTDNSGATTWDEVSVTVNAAPPTNQSPSVNAGPDQVITLPVNGTTLHGLANDTDGSIASYQWSQVSGPSGFALATPSSASTILTGLVQGVYVFRLMVTDNQGASAADEIQITVNPPVSLPNQAPLADAGSDLVITLPVNSVHLTGSGSDPEGTIVRYQWTLVSGPSGSQISSPGTALTDITGMKEGNYLLRLTVWDNTGASASDTVTVTVKPEIKTRSTASVYPNPATSYINVRIDALTSKSYSVIRIFNAAGVAVYTETFVRTQQVEIRQIDISRFEKGVYLVNVNADINTVVSAKFVKM